MFGMRFLTSRIVRMHMRGYYMASLPGMLERLGHSHAPCGAPAPSRAASPMQILPHALLALLAASAAYAARAWLVGTTHRRLALSVTRGTQADASQKAAPLGALANDATVSLQVCLGGMWRRGVHMRTRVRVVQALAPVA